jgi:GNAT superfamily N-acetyltransferase
MQVCTGTMTAKEAAATAVTIRRVRPSDAGAVLAIYRHATRVVHVEGVEQILVDHSYVFLMAMLSGVCLLKNWWRAHIALYLGYLALPTVIGHIFAVVTAKFSSDVISPHEYFDRPKSTMLVAEMDGKLVGTVGIKVAQEKKVVGHFAGLRKEGDAELVRMNILPTHQGHGISKLLMQAAIDFCKENKYKRIVLTSSTINRVATEVVYPKYGFVLEKKTGFYAVYPVFMSKVL